MPSPLSRARHLKWHCSALAIVAVLAVTPAHAQFASAIDLGSLNGITGFRLDGIDVFDRSGYSAASAGDVNGDGFGDIVIGAFSASANGFSQAGQSYVVFGKAAGFASAIGLGSLNGATGFRLDGIDTRDRSGISVASAGDVNGDGFGDLVIGAFLADPNGNSSAGESYVVFGNAKSFASAIDLGSLNGTTGFRLDGIDAFDNSGWSVAAAGDVNGDGLGDLVVGAFFAAPGGDFQAGESYVVFGRVTRFPSAIDLGSLNGATGFRLDGIDAEDRSGNSVASAGDVNGDGFADIVIAAYGADPGGVSIAGESYVVFGKAAGFASAIDLGSLNGTTGFRLDGIDANDGSGQSAASAGDVNGDGFADIVIGARTADPNGDSYAGESYVVFGRAPGGFASAIALASLDGTTGFRLDGIDANDSGGRSVASAGDVNGDGFADIVIGATGASPNGHNSAGETYVIFGQAGGFASAIDLGSLNGTTGFRLDGIDTADRSGLSVASAGDVNGDGFADIVIGAKDADPNGNSSAGESYVVFGRPPVVAVTRIGSAAGQYISGGAFADRLFGRDGNDTLEGRGGGDVLRGDSGLDTASYRHAAAPVSADLANGAANTGDAAGDTYRSIENLRGSSRNDVLRGDNAANVLTGGKGQDKLTGLGGDDIFKYDRLDDSRVGTQLRDRIGDFNAGTSATRVDRIDLSAIDAKTGPSNDAFSFIGTAPFHNVKGELRVEQVGTTAVVSGDINGNGVADFEIGLLNFTTLANLTSIDFIR